jgi:hypothetical protein
MTRLVPCRCQRLVAQLDQCRPRRDQLFRISDDGHDGIRLRREAGEVDDGIERGKLQDRTHDSGISLQRAACPLPRHPTPSHAIPRSSQIGVGLSVLGFSITRSRAITGSLRLPHPIFSTFVANKGGSRNQRLGDACVALGWPLRGPWVALAWPLGGPRVAQTQSRVGRGSQSQYAARRNDRRATNCHRERAAKSGSPASALFSLAGVR